MSAVLTPSHTHNTTDKLTKLQIEEKLTAIQARLTETFSSEPEKLDALLTLLDELNEFEWGRFLIQNQGALSGYWTWYVILGFRNEKALHPRERIMLEQIPVILATRERFDIFQQLLLQHIQSNSVVCSVPCGMMSDLLSLDIPGTVSDVRFVGIDLDETVFGLAQDLAQQLKNPFNCTFFKEDAFSLPSTYREAFDIITTNGLNIYEKDDDRVVAFYRGLLQALKVGGKLICSALTPPNEWDNTKIPTADLQLSREIFGAVLGASWANFRPAKKTIEQLEAAGFENVEMYGDARQMFPSFCATRPVRI